VEPAAPADAEGLRPCILFLDSCVEHGTKQLFSMLRQFLEIYWNDCRRSSRRQSAGTATQEAPQPTAAAATEDGEPSAAGGATAGSSAGDAKKRRRSYASDCTWFTNSSIPQVICSSPQQKNDFDCGLFMLHTIELLATGPLPSFATTDGILDALGPKLFTQDDISRRREEVHRELCEKASISVDDEVE